MVWRLVDAGEAVVVLDLLSTGFQWAVAPEATFVQGDIADEALVEQLIADHDIDAVIHFAGSVVVPDSVSDPLGYYLNNTVKSRALMAAVIRAGVRCFIFSSTAAVYGDTGTEPVLESAATVPQSPYGRSKLMTEMMLEDAARAHDFRYVALRYFNIAGADPRGRTGQSTRGATHLIKVACETALGKREAIELFGTDYDTPDGTCVRDYIHVADLANAHADALAYLRAGGDSLVANCGYGHGYSVREVLASVRRVSGRDFRVIERERRPGDVPAVVANSTRARNTLRWSPMHDDLDACVATALAWEEGLGRRNQRD